MITRTWFGLIMALVFGVTVATGEYRHGTATGTYLATPDRARVLAAKTIAAAAAGLLFGLAAAALTTGITVAFVAAKGYHLVLAAGTIARFAAGAVLAAGLLAAAGAGVGSLIRSQLAAILTVFAWGIVAEQVIGGLFTSIKPYLPYTAATTRPRCSAWPAPSWSKPTTNGKSERRYLSEGSMALLDAPPSDPKEVATPALLTA